MAYIGRREYSDIGIYHVMIRGNRKEKIFLDNSDRQTILNIIRDAKQEREFVLYAYCLMGNHDHLLIKEFNPKDISKIMFYINSEYARFFNKKYGLVGHLQQDRFKSEIIKDQAYFLNCIRYIHNNPVKANIVQRADEYKWSSNNIYNGEKDYFKIVDKDDLYNLIGGSKRYEPFMAKKTYQVFLEPQDSYDSIKSESAEMLIHDFMKEQSLNLYNINKAENKSLRNILIRRLRDESRLTNKRISQMLELSEDLVKKIK